MKNQTKIEDLIKDKSTLFEFEKEIERIRRGNDTLCLALVEIENCENMEKIPEFKEIYEDLKPGGRLRIYDIATKLDKNKILLGIVNCKFFKDKDICKHCPICKRACIPIKHIAEKYKLPIKIRCGIVKIPTETLDLNEALNLAWEKVEKTKEVNNEVVVE